MKEESVIAIIEKALGNRYYINNHGSLFSRSGVPDFITLDSDHRFTGIEAKAPSGHPYPNQWRRAIEILRSGGRFIIGLNDFTREALDNHEFPTFELIRPEIGETEFMIGNQRFKQTTEVIIR